MGKNVKNLVTLISVFFISACARELEECNGPALNLSLIKSIQNDTYGTGPKGYLVLDNPIDATGIGNISAGDSRILSAQKTYQLVDLLNPASLVSKDNVIIKLNSYTDTTGLATTNASGEYQYDFNDPRYWQMVSYLEIKKALNYVASLGFKLNRPKPLYAFTNASDSETSADTVNAFYEPNLFGGNPTIKFYNGMGDYKLLRDGDVPQHETGHYILYHITKSIGDADLAVDYGGQRSVASGFHEGFADYILETIENKPYIARWAARNFNDITVGSPLRRAENSAGDTLSYNDVFESDGSIGILDRYQVGKWVSRVLWNIRKEFLKEDKNAGNIFADRVVLSAASLLPKDSSISDVKNALLQADGALHCGLHKRTIEKSFEDMGYKPIDSISSGLGLQYQVVGITYDSNGNAQITTPRAGGTLGFRLRITNNSGTRARDVRANLSSSDSRLHVSAYMQAYGDLPGGRSIDVGSGLPIEFSPTADIDQSASGKIKFTLTISFENGPPKVINGEFTL